MARHTKSITITDDNRDKGKTFLLTELASYDAEMWVWKLIPVLSAVGFTVDDNVLKGGFAAIAAMGAAAILRMPYEVTKSLLDEMLACIGYVHNPAHAPQPIYLDAKCQIEEISTWFQLRKAVLELHTDPLKAAGASTSGTQHPLPAA